ncbi:MAG: nitrogen regulatory protein P-II 1 [Pseudohongiellaceae bacterium]|jgi:nitrogen regulatory protein P-II 1
MSQREITVLTDVSMITCIVQRGIADKIVAAAHEAGATGATIYFARGEGVRERLGILALAVEAEKEVIIVAVADDQADHIFERMYIAGELDTPGMGFIYMTKLDKAATHIPQEILAKLEAGEIKPAPNDRL